MMTDTTPNYIKMCRKAKELQKAWIPMIGDYCKHPKGAWGDTAGWVITKFFHITQKVSVFRGTASISCYYKYENYEDFLKEKCVWLPHQDQLQKMANSCCTDPICLLLSFKIFVVDLPSPAPPYTNSFEQLWLAFVMGKLYGKIWDGEDWKVLKTVKLI